MVGGPSRWSGSGRGTLPVVRSGRWTLPEVRKWSGDPPVGQELVGGRSRRSENGLGTLPQVRKWSGDPPGGLEVLGGPSRRYGIG